MVAGLNNPEPTAACFWVPQTRPSESLQNLPRDVEHLHLARWMTATVDGAAIRTDVLLSEVEQTIAKPIP